MGLLSPMVGEKKYSICKKSYGKNLSIKSVKRIKWLCNVKDKAENIFIN